MKLIEDDKKIKLELSEEESKYLKEKAKEIGVTLEELKIYVDKQDLREYSLPNNKFLLKGAKSKIKLAAKFN